MKRWLIAGAVGWLGCLAALVGLLAIQEPLVPPATPVLQAPEANGGNLEQLSCTREIATVDSDGNTHLTTVDCK